MNIDLWKLRYKLVAIEIIFQIGKFLKCCFLKFEDTHFYFYFSTRMFSLTMKPHDSLYSPRVAPNSPLLGVNYYLVGNCSITYVYNKSYLHSIVGIIY